MTLDIFLSIIIVVLYWISHHNLVCKIEQMRRDQEKIMKRLQSLDNMQMRTILTLKKFYPEK